MSGDMETDAAKEVIKEGADRFYKQMNAKEDIDTRLADLKDKLEKSQKGYKRRQQAKFISNYCRPNMTEGELDLFDVTEIARSYNLPDALIYWLMWRDKMIRAGLNQSEILAVAKESIQSDPYLYDLVTNMDMGGSRIFNHIENELSQYASMNDDMSWDDDSVLCYLYDALIEREKNRSAISRKDNRTGRSTRNNRSNVSSKRPKMRPVFDPAFAGFDPMAMQYAMPGFPGGMPGMNMMNPYAKDLAKLFKKGKKGKGKKSKR